MIDTLDEAKELADGDTERIWFVRDMDEDPENLEEFYFAIEPWAGQFVNCFGFLVTVEKVKEEHRDKFFVY